MTFCNGEESHLGIGIGIGYRFVPIQTAKLNMFLIIFCGHPSFKVLHQSTEINQEKTMNYGVGIQLVKARQ